jgi:general secretion pathway protein A
MVLDFYNLKDQPFGVTPDPRYLYASESHREALASLSYGIRSRRGFMSLIAKPGMGKTTILFQLLRQLEGSARTVFLFQTLCSPKELLRDLLRDLGVVEDGSDAGRMQEQLNRVLTAEARQGRRVVVVIDEAQNLEDSALELLRMLSNFETTDYKLMQIILSGQPQLGEKLASPQLQQLRQRMAILARLRPFTPEETHFYVQHRLRVAGYNSKTSLFTPEAAALIAQYSEGIPRNINNICFNAISLGYVLRQKSIREEVVRECLVDMCLETESISDRNSAEPDKVTFSAIKPRSDFRAPFEWPRRLAFCLILLMICFSSGGSGQPKLQSRLHVSVTAVPSLPPARPSTEARSEALVDQSPDVRLVSTEREPGPAPTPELSGNAMPSRQQGVSSSKTRGYLADRNEQANDPAALWARVKNQNSDAEIELARLYLEGLAVPRNCVQAKVLLLAASRKGNARAADLLSDTSSQCR